jgi:DNA segregation ATPase FtsK/SpoIIIE, S-DNA-T family
VKQTVSLVSTANVATTLRRLWTVMNDRYRYMLAHGVRVAAACPGELSPIVLVVDEAAYYSAIANDDRQRQLMTTLLRDLAVRGRAADITVTVTPTPKFSDAVPASLRPFMAHDDGVLITGGEA